MQMVVNGVWCKENRFQDLHIIMRRKSLARDDDMIETLHEMIDTDLLVPSYVWSQLTLKILKFSH